MMVSLCHAGGGAIIILTEWLLLTPACMYVLRILHVILHHNSEPNP